MKKTDFISRFIFFFVCLFAYGCQQSAVFEKTVTIPGYKWKADYTVKGEIEITDTAEYYDVYLILRHTDAYKYNNIWIDASLTQGKDSLFFRNRNISLGNDQSGWEGSGMDDIWDVRKKISVSPVKFNQSGKYHFSLQQIMRDDPLSSVMCAGIRVEQVNK